MSEIRNVRLDFLRPGLAHNQLLSPLTPYLALCGAAGPVTVSVPFEHRQLLSRLERLRYFSDGREIAPGQRAAEVREMGEAMGRVLGQIPALLAELGGTPSDGSGLVHLRLSITAYELALVPFELAIGVDGFPGSGSPLVLQTDRRISLTREVRRGRPLPVSWNRPPRILFAFASPNELSPVPAQAHLEALRRAIAPWTKWRSTETERIAQVKEHLTVLPNASLQKIRGACAGTEYTHVHILAHGAPVGIDGDRRYGIALCSDANETEVELVDGEALATALTANDLIGTKRLPPTVVTLATCDSGHPGSVISPGGSIAHALHAGGIPWVIASQFPLWKHASVVAAELLYLGLLRGDDPRWVLHTVRERLRTDFTTTHDWAALVAYAAVPWAFERQVEAFRNWQTRHAIEVKFDEVEHRVVARLEIEPLLETIRGDLTRWRAELPDSAAARQRAERLGMSAASEKRMGDVFRRRDKESAAARAAYERALDFYEQALKAEPVNHWVVTQALCMRAVLAEAAHDASLGHEYGAWWVAARQIVEWDLRTARGESRVWALGTLAELELLGAVYNGGAFDVVEAGKRITTLCRDLCDSAGRDTFAVFSTRRQFLRYRELWPRDCWNKLAEMAATALGAGPSWVGRAYQGPDA